MIAVRKTAVYTAGFRSRASGNDLVLIRSTTSGKKVWMRTYRAGARWWTWPADVVVDKTGNVTVLGMLSKAEDFVDILLVSYRPNGRLRCARRYDGPAYGGDWATRMATDPAGNVYIAGWSESRTGSDGLVLKYVRSGKRLWARRYNGTVGGDDWLRSLRLRPAGGIYAAGSTTGGHTGRNGLLTAYNAAGKRLFVTEEVGPGTKRSRSSSAISRYWPAAMSSAWERKTREAWTASTPSTAGRGSCAAG